MRTIFAEYNPQCNSIDVYTSAGYMLRIDCYLFFAVVRQNVIQYLIQCFQ